MSRLVRRDVRLGNRAFGLQASPVRAQIASVAPAVANQAAADQTDTDDYTTRIVKYIPAEVVAFYQAADKLFHSHCRCRLPVPLRLRPALSRDTELDTGR
jgi:hypothetical protein